MGPTELGRQCNPIARQLSYSLCIFLFLIFFQRPTKAWGIIQLSQATASKFLLKKVPGTDFKSFSQSCQIEVILKSFLKDVPLPNRIHIPIKLTPVWSSSHLDIFLYILYLPKIYSRNENLICNPPKKSHFTDTHISSQPLHSNG